MNDGKIDANGVEIESNEIFKGEKNNLQTLIPNKIVVTDK
jgi:hypothetical protein